MLQDLIEVTCILVWFLKYVYQYYIVLFKESKEKILTLNNVLYDHLVYLFGVFGVFRGCKNKAFIKCGSQKVIYI